MKPGLCECGCGQKTRLARRSCTKQGWVRGQPLRFIQGHNARGKGHNRWNGGRAMSRGYVLVEAPAGHPRAHVTGYVMEHLLVAGRALGRPVPETAHVHHVNEDPADNRPSNLVICEDAAYHHLLHRRKRALDMCGNANWMPCRRCGEYDDPSNMYVYPNGNAAYHRMCHARYNREQRAREAVNVKVA